jgi:hypothetical protein
MRSSRLFPSAGVVMLAASVTVAFAQGGFEGSGSLSGDIGNTGTGAAVGGSSVGAAGSSTADGTGATIDASGNLGDRGMAPATSVAP